MSLDIVTTGKEKFMEKLTLHHHQLDYSSVGLHILVDYYVWIAQICWYKEYAQKFHPISILPVVSKLEQTVYNKIYNYLSEHKLYWHLSNLDSDLYTLHRLSSTTSLNLCSWRLRYMYCRIFVKPLLIQSIITLAVLNKLSYYGFKNIFSMV